jgi:hypothetical protein
MALVNPKTAAGALKAPLHHLEPVADEQIAYVLESGARKYGARNFRQSEIPLSVYVAAAKRHLAAIVSGEWLDPESGRSHWAHVGANVHVVLSAEDAGTLHNDLTPEPEDERVELEHLAYLRSIEPDEDPSPREPTVEVAPSVGFRDGDVAEVALTGERVRVRVVPVDCDLRPEGVPNIEPSMGLGSLESIYGAGPRRYEGSE